MINIKNTASKKEIPAFVSSWTDGYFHKSAFDAPNKYPNKKVINFLSQFKKKERIKLYRGINKYNGENELITSWTYDKRIAESYIKDGGRVMEKDFSPEDVLFDTTILNSEQKKLLGYDYKVDDREVLITRGKRFLVFRRK